MDYILLYLLLGCFSGFVAGLFGIGGGMVIVPVLVFSFQAQGLSPTILTHLAIGTSLATIIVTSISAVLAHHQRGAVLWPVVKKLAIGLLIGSLIGAQIAHAIPARQLEIIIGCFALLTAAQMFTGYKGKLGDIPLPKTAGLATAGGGIGIASAIFGIGGGTFTVPYLTVHGVGMANAVASASACGLPIAFAGAGDANWLMPGSAFPAWLIDKIVVLLRGRIVCVVYFDRGYLYNVPFVWLLFQKATG